MARALSLFVLPLVMAFLAPEVSAGEIYGRVDYSLTSSHSGWAAHNNTSGLTFENNFTRVGLRGSEPMGDLWEFFYRIEVGVQAEDQDHGGTPFNSRPTYLGISGPLGRLAAGRIDPVFKMSKGFVDAFDNYSTKHDRLMAGDRRHGDSLEYWAPGRWGFRLGGSLLLEDEYFAAGDPRRDNGNYQLSLRYGDKFFRHGNLYAALAYSDGIEDVKATRVVVHWRLGSWQLGGLFQATENADPRATGHGQRQGNGYFVSLTRRTGHWKIKAQAGADDSGSGLIARRIYADLGVAPATVPEVSALALGFERFFSAGLRVHFELGWFQVDGVSGYDDTIVSLGTRYDF